MIAKQELTQNNAYQTKDTDPTNILVLHLSVWKSMPHFLFHSARRLRSSCSTWRASWLFIRRYRMQSSANSLVLNWTQSERSLIKIKNNRGPRTVPCGTPLITWIQSDVEPSTKTPAVSGLSGKPLSSCG